MGGLRGQQQQETQGQMQPESESLKLGHCLPTGWGRSRQPRTGHSPGEGQPWPGCGGPSRGFSLSAAEESFRAPIPAGGEGAEPARDASPSCTGRVAIQAQPAGGREGGALRGGCEARAHRDTAVMLVRHGRGSRKAQSPWGRQRDWRGNPGSSVAGRPRLLYPVATRLGGLSVRVEPRTSPSKSRSLSCLL